MTNSYTYDPFGVTTETKALLTNVFNPWRYTGQYQDTTTGLYKMGARYYQPELGRWTQRDPSGLEANAYLYVAGNPINFIDPSGLLSINEVARIAAQAFTVVGLVALVAHQPASFLRSLAQPPVSPTSLVSSLATATASSWRSPSHILGAATFGSLQAAGFRTVGQATDPSSVPSLRSSILTAR